MYARPVTADQAAARALGLSALVCRETMEDAAPDPRAAEMHALVLRWLDQSGASKGLESHELRVLAAPLGTLERQARALAYWRLEQLSVLGWALGKVPAPQPWERHEPRWVARRVGFLRNDAADIVRAATIRPPAELAMFAAHLEEARERLLKMLADDPEAEEVKLGVAATAERLSAVSWLVGEKALALEAPLLA